jgi:hypothetical protein
MSETGTTRDARSGAAWLEGLGERQKILARLCALKADDTQLQEALARMMDCYSPLEKPRCFLAIEALLPPSAFWRAFHQHWQASNSRRTGVTFGRLDEGGFIGELITWLPKMLRRSPLFRKR